MKVMLAVLCIGSALLLVTSAQALQSMTMAAGCRLPDDSVEQMRLKEDWLARIKGFLPARDPTDKNNLRIPRETEADARVLNAESGLRRTCSDYRAGKFSESDADNILSGHELTIREYLHDVANAAYLKAASGQASQIESVRRALIPIATTGGQAEKLGLKEIADEAHDSLMKTFNDFDSGLAKSCKDQVFDANLIYGLLRQEDDLGVQNGIQPCAYRVAKVDFVDGRKGWTIKHCGLGYGKWQVNGDGPTLAGSGTGESDMQGDGHLSVKFTRFLQFAADGIEEAKMKFRCTPTEACECRFHPSTKECQEKYPGESPPIVWLMNFDFQSASGSITMSHRILPFSYVDRTGLFAIGKDVAVEFKLIDKPCDPDKMYQ